MKNPILVIGVAAGSLFLVHQSAAVPFEVIRVGDVDGFGYKDGAGLVAANGGPVNVDGVGVLVAGDFLPSLNRNGSVATGSGDDFDNRSGEAVGVVGAVNTGTLGIEYTDISLSTSYDTSSSSGTVYDANTGAMGAGGPFPGDGNPNTLSNQPGFVFDFFVSDGDVSPTSKLFFNLVFGDYDVTPAKLQLTLASGVVLDVSLSTQPGAKDGLIQESSLELAFGDVFSGAVGGWAGYLGVDFVAPNEPYTAFDFVELSIIDDPGGIVIPPGVPDAGTTFVLLGLSSLALAGLRRRHS